FVVRSMKLTGCAANSMPSRIPPVRIVLFIFNDGSSTGPGDRSGDHFGTIQAVRDSDTADPPGRLRVEAFVSRCSDPLCNNSTTVVENDPARDGAGQHAVHAAGGLGSPQSPVPGQRRQERPCGAVLPTVRRGRRPL